MKISLIIPTAYTPEPWFSNCIKRVDEEFRGKDVEVIISEDGIIPQEMKDKYPDFAIVLEHPEPSGCGLARKRAIEISTGDIICFLDSDDEICRGYVDNILDSGPNTEYYFNNVDLNGHEEIIDTKQQKYGHFQLEMVWNKSYDGPALRNCMSKYNPPLMMTPAEDLFMNCVYLGENKDFSFKQKPVILLNRYVRQHGLAMSTAKDDRNRLKQMQVSLDYMRNNPRNEEVYFWVSTYTNIIEQRIKQQPNISGYKWYSEERAGQVHEPISFKITDTCNRNCGYCANKELLRTGAFDDEQQLELALKTQDCIQRWERCHGLPNTIVLSGGEPTLINPKYFQELFSKYDKYTFIIYTNGYKLDEWIKATPDNVLFKLHLVDENIPLKYVCNDRIHSMIVIGTPEHPEIKDAISSLKCDKLQFILAHQYKDINTEQIDRCRSVDGVYIIDVERDVVWPCCGVNNWDNQGTIENLPIKRNNKRCSSCRNSCDNVTLV